MAANDRLNTTIRQRLVAARQFRGWDHETLAMRSGLTVERTKECETAGEIYAVEILAIADALALPISHFVEGCALCGVVSEH